MPHLGHVIVLAIVDVMDDALTDLGDGVRTISSRWRVTSVVAVHTRLDIDPGEPTNISVLLAVESTQAVPQSLCMNNFAPQNM